MFVLYLCLDYVCDSGNVRFEIFVEDGEIYIYYQVSGVEKSVKIGVYAWFVNGKGVTYKSRFGVCLWSPRFMRMDDDSEAYGNLGKLPHNEEDSVWISINTDCVFAPSATSIKDKLFIE